MDIAISPVSGVIRVPVPSAVTTVVNTAGSNPVPAVQAQVQPSPVQTPDTDIDANNTATSIAVEKKYEAAVQQIAQSFKGSYAVSDKQFSIFKDITGKYITRYVSLRDGSITYVPTAPAVVRPPAVGVTVTA